MQIVRAAERIEHLHRAYHVRLRARAAGGVEGRHVAGRVGAGERRLSASRLAPSSTLVVDAARPLITRTLTVLSWLMLITCSLASSAQPWR